MNGRAHLGFKEPEGRLEETPSGGEGDAMRVVQQRHLCERHARARAHGGLVGADHLFELTDRFVTLLFAKVLRVVGGVGIDLGEGALELLLILHVHHLREAPEDGLLTQQPRAHSLVDGEHGGHAVHRRDVRLPRARGVSEEGREGGGADVTERLRVVRPILLVPLWREDTPEQRERRAVRGAFFVAEQPDELKEQSGAQGFARGG